MFILVFDNLNKWNEFLELILFSCLKIYKHYKHNIYIANSRIILLENMRLNLMKKLVKKNYNNFSHL